MFQCGARSKVRLGLAIAALSAVASPAFAQYSRPIFLELMRDPGRVSVPPTARLLGLAGVTTVPGAADAAVTNPAALKFGQGTDGIVSLGAFFYARNELVSTPRQLPPFDATRAPSSPSAAPVAFVAVATRHATWAAAGFVDASARYAHAFSTERALVVSTSLFPTVLIEHAAVSAALTQSVTRIGGSVAAGDRRERVSVGASVSLVRLRYSGSSEATVDYDTSSIQNPALTHSCCQVETDAVRFADTKLGLVLGAAVRPVPQLTIMGHWRRDPACDSTRELTITGVLPQPPSSEPVTFQLPNEVTIGTAVELSRTLIAVEFSRGFYAGVFSPDNSSLAGVGADPNYACGHITQNCPGWNFAYHETKNANSLRIGIEQAVPVGRGRLLLRGGVAHEEAYTLAREANDPSTRRTLEFPAPAIVTPFEPPREDATWLSFGAAFAWRRGEIGFGLGTANHQTRLLVDVRFSG